MRLLTLFAALVIGGAPVAAGAAAPSPIKPATSTSPTPLPLGPTILHLNLFRAPQGTTLTIKTSVIPVQSWSLSTDLPVDSNTGAAVGKTQQSPLTVTVAFGPSTAFLQQDSLNNTGIQTAILRSPTESIRLDGVLVTGFSISGSGSASTATFTLTFAKIQVAAIGSTGSTTAAPCPTSPPNPTLCLTGAKTKLDPITVTTWNISGGEVSGGKKKPTILAFTMTGGSQLEALQQMQLVHEALTNVVFKANGVVYTFKNATLSALAVQGTGNTAKADVTLTADDVAMST